MAAFIVFEHTLGDHVANIVSSFLYRSQTVAASFGTDANDIANLEDLNGWILWPFSDEDLELLRQLSE